MPGRTLRGKKLFEQKPCKTARIVTDDAALLEEIVENDAIAKFLKFWQIDLHLLGTLTPIAPDNFRRNRLAIGHHPVHD
jgi:hypothetical protein